MHSFCIRIELFSVADNFVLRMNKVDAVVRIEIVSRTTSRHAAMTEDLEDVLRMNAVVRPSFAVLEQS